MLRLIEPLAIVDAYDDPGFGAKMDKGASIIPEFVKSVQRLSKSQLAALPDHVFAVVVYERGRAMHRKWPLIDPAHVWLAAFYWKSTDGVVPDAVRGVAAHYILDAADLHGLHHLLPFRDSLEKSRAGLSAVPSHNVVNLCVSGMRISELTRNSSPDFVGLKKTSSSEVYALPSRGKYPISNEELLSKAASWFVDNEKDIEFLQRFEMAGNMAKQASALNAKLPDAIWKYAECDVTANSVDLIRMRLLFSNRRGFPKHGSAVIRGIAKLAEDGSAPAKQLMLALASFDKEAGISVFWGKSLPDPAVTFAAGGRPDPRGSDYVAELDGDLVTHSMLAKIGSDRRESVRRVFGDKVAKALSAPESAPAAFNAMSADHQRALVGLLDFAGGVHDGASKV